MRLRATKLTVLGNSSINQGNRIPGDSSYVLLSDYRRIKLLDGRYVKKINSSTTRYNVLLDEGLELLLDDGNFVTIS